MVIVGGSAGRDTPQAVANPIIGTPGVLDTSRLTFQPIVAESVRRTVCVAFTFIHGFTASTGRYACRRVGPHIDTLITGPHHITTPTTPPRAESIKDYASAHTSNANRTRITARVIHAGTALRSTLAAPTYAQITICACGALEIALAGHSWGRPACRVTVTDLTIEAPHPVRATP